MALTKSSSDENTWDWKHCYNLKKQETQEAEEHKTFATVEDEEMANYQNKLALDSDRDLVSDSACFIVQSTGEEADISSSS